MSTKGLLRKMEILAEIKKLEEVLAELLANVIAGSLAAALGDPRAKEALPHFQQKLEALQARAEELQAENETLDLLASMGMDVQD
jgi:hypothetical protein